MSALETRERRRTLEQLAAELLAHLDAEPGREGLADTPKRWAKAMRALVTPRPFDLTTFENDGYSQMVVQESIPFFSLCEHHLLPFFGEAVVGYVPGPRIVGISKLARTVEHFARGLQVQERMTEQVADFLQQRLEPKGVGVILRARHLCQEMRGVEKVGAVTTTSALKGTFLSDPTARAEFLSLRRADAGRAMG